MLRLIVDTRGGNRGQYRRRLSDRVVTGGWHNHYDDPDEFWDDEPLVVSKSESASCPGSVVANADDRRPSSTRVSSSDTAVGPTGPVASATADAAGLITDLRLNGGLCVRADPSWLVAQQISAAARALVQAVNSARAEAALGGGSPESAGEVV